MTKELAMSIDLAAFPVEAEPPHPGNDRTILGLTELLLKDAGRLDRLTRDDDQQPRLIPSFLAIALASFGLFGLALVLALWWAQTAALPKLLATSWEEHRAASALGLWLAYTLGFALATGVCLPSFYFYGLLAGVRISWMQVTAQIMKGSSATAVMLLGILPVYLAAALGAVVFQLPPPAIRAVLDVGLGLPFVAGLWGVRSIYVGFLGLADTLPPERLAQRECWLRRLTLACTACYSAVCPVMIYKLWTYFTEHLVQAGL
jgi:hypothetical protein